MSLRPFAVILTLFLLVTLAPTAQAQRDITVDLVINGTMRTVCIIDIRDGWIEPPLGLEAPLVTLRLPPQSVEVPESQLRTPDVYVERGGKRILDVGGTTVPVGGQSIYVPGASDTLDPTEGVRVCLILPG